MRKSTIAGAAIMASLALAGTAQADSVTTPNVGWTTTNPSFDQGVMGTGFRMSNAFQAGSFGDQPHSKPVLKPAGENEAMNVLVNEFTVKTTSSLPQPGLSLSVSQDEGNGTRMSYLRFDDLGDGVHVFFNATTPDGDFTSEDIATLDYAVAYQIKIETTFVKGDDNDVVRIFIDGIQKARGSSWENYYRFNEERNPGAVDRLLVRAGAQPYGETHPALRGNGLLFDNVTTTSSHVNNPAPLNPPAPGPAGPKGDTGATGAQGSAGANGINGTTTSITQSASASKLIGARIRTLHVPSRKGMKLVSVRGSLRNKHLPVHGQSITVDLRGKVVGNYNVLITAKYRTKSGKVHTVRSIRSLSITLR